MRVQFPGLEDKEIDNLPEIIFGRPKRGFRYSLYMALSDNGELAGFLIYSFFSRYNFYFLDHMAASPGQTGRGIGGQMYGFLRAKAKAKPATGIFFECLNDDPADNPDPVKLEQNRARLKFYEKFGARPLANNRFHVKVKADNNSTLLVFDPLARDNKLPRDTARKIIRRILLKKYSDYCPPAHIKMVVDSFTDDPATIREPRYARR